MDKITERALEEATACLVSQSCDWVKLVSATSILLHEKDKIDLKHPVVKKLEHALNKIPNKLEEQSYFMYNCGRLAGIMSMLR